MIGKGLGFEKVHRAARRAVLRAVPHPTQNTAQSTVLRLPLPLRYMARSTGIHHRLHGPLEGFFFIHRGSVALRVPFADDQRPFLVGFARRVAYRPSTHPPPTHSHKLKLIPDADMKCQAIVGPSGDGGIFVIEQIGSGKVDAGVR